MLKKVLLILSILIFVPCFANEHKNKSEQGGPVFIYLHTANCGYCKKVTPNFNKLAQNNKGICYFMSVDADTKDGTVLMMQFNARYVPYAVLMDTEKPMIR